MPYCQAYECLQNPNSTLAELLESLEDVICQYVYIATTANSGSRKEPEEDLLRLLGIKLALKARIQKYEISINHN